jgi:hypothetical protein
MSEFSIPKPKTVSKEHIDSQYERLIDIIKKTQNPERCEKLLRMYRMLEQRVKTAPASAKVQYHNAYDGGYLDHILNVIEFATRIQLLYRDMNGVVDFTYEELVFAAMHHDLGKLGDDEGPRYLPETEEYWIKKGSVYKYKDDRQFMSVFDRTVLLLNAFEVKLNKKELVAIRMADGLFPPANEEYFQPKVTFAHRSSLVYIIHWADWMACNQEKDLMRVNYEQLNNFPK